MRKPSSEVLRIVGLSTLIFGIGLLATSCSSSSSTSSTAAAPIQVRIWRTGQDEDALKSYITAFINDNKSVALNVTYDNRKIDTYELDALKSLAARQGPDIWSIPDDWLGDHAPRIQPLPTNFFYPFDDKGVQATTGNSTVDSVKNLFPTGISEQLITDDGKGVYGMPTNVDTLRLYYNSDILSQAQSEFVHAQPLNASSASITPVQQLLSKPPATWADLVAQAQYITKLNGSNIERATIALGTSNNLTNSADILQLLMMQNGVQITSSDRRNALFHIPTVTPAGVTLYPGEKALDFFTSFANPGKATYDWSPSMPQDVDAFAQGKVAMIIGFSDLANTLSVKYPHFNYETAPIPQNSTVDTPVNLIRFSTETVTKTTDNAAASFALMRRYTTANAAQGIASQIKLSSPYLDTLNNQDDPIVKQILTGKTVYKRSRIQFDQIFNQMPVDVNQNGLTTAQAIDKAAELINQLLQTDTRL